MNTSYEHNPDYITAFKNWRRYLVNQVDVHGLVLDSDQVVPVVNYSIGVHGAEWIGDPAKSILDQLYDTWGYIRFESPQHITLFIMKWL